MSIQNAFALGTFLGADDIAAVIKSRSSEEAQSRLHQTMLRTKNCLENHGFQLVLQKTDYQTTYLY